MENLSLLAVLARSLAAFGKEKNASCGTASNWAGVGIKAFSLIFFLGKQNAVLFSHGVIFFWHYSSVFHKGHTQGGTQFRKKVPHLEIHHHCMALSKHIFVQSVFHMTEWLDETCDASTKCNSNSHSTFCSTRIDHHGYSSTLLVCWQ